MSKSPRGSIGGLTILAPLGVDEERALYPIIRDGRLAARRLLLSTEFDAATRRKLMRERHEGQVAESTLLRATLGLVRARVMERGYRLYNDDFEAAGVEGLVNALHRFDPAAGTRFSTYANYWITKLVNQAVQQRAGLTDTEMRLVVKFQRLERSSSTRLTKRAVASELGVSQLRANEIMQLSRELQSRRFESVVIDDVAEPRAHTERSGAPSWVIDEVKRLTGDDFDAFWQYTFKTMSMEEIAKGAGISRQAMAKRLDKCRRAVRESPEAERLQRWFDQQ